MFTINIFLKIILSVYFKFKVFLQKFKSGFAEFPDRDTDLIGSLTGIFKLQDAYLIEPMEFKNVSKKHPSFRLRGFTLKLFSQKNNTVTP